MAAAFDDYLIAYKLDSTQNSAGIYLARLQAGCPVESLRDASKAIENATNMCVRTNWKDWIAISVLAAAYSEADDFDKALNYAKLAYELAPDDEKDERLHGSNSFKINNLIAFRKRNLLLDAYS